MDLSRVAAACRPEIGRRVAILERYVAIERPDGAQDEAAAADIGVSVATMLRMARIWREHRRPELLPGATVRSTIRSRNPTDRTSARSVPTAVDATASEPPTDATLVGQVGLLARVGTIEGTRLPVLQAAFDAEAGRILAWRLSDRSLDPPAAAAILYAVLARYDLVDRDLMLEVGFGAGWTAVTDALHDAGVPYSITTGRAPRVGGPLLTALGHSIHGIRPTARLAAAPSTNRTTWPTFADLASLEDQVAAAIRRHNAARPAPTRNRSRTREDEARPGQRALARIASANTARSEDPGAMT